MSASGLGNSDNLIYCLEPFLAFQDGQVTMRKNEALLLLNDEHFYWWYVQSTETAKMGYVPAELLELPNERLARHNKEINISILRTMGHYHDEPMNEPDRPQRRPSVRFDDEKALPELVADDSSTSSSDDQLDSPTAGLTPDTTSLPPIELFGGHNSSANLDCGLQALDIDHKMLPNIIENLSRIREIQRKLDALVEHY